MLPHLHAVMPSLGSWRLRLLVLPDFTQMGLPPGPHEYLLQVLYQQHLNRPYEEDMGKPSKSNHP